MSLFFQVKSSYWRLRAEETRVLADTMTTNLHAYGVMLRNAEDYERLADIADRENCPQRSGSGLARDLVIGHPAFCVAGEQSNRAVSFQQMQ